MRWVIGFVLAAVAVTGFASTFVAGSALTRDYAVSPAVLSFLRFLAAGGALLAFEAASPSGRRALRIPAKTNWFAFCLLGATGTSVMAWCVFAGCQRVGTANASLADALAPLMIFLATAFRSRHVGWSGVIGLLCGFIGALLVIKVVTADGFNLETYSTGDLYILLAALTWAIYTVWGRAYVARMGSAAFSVWTMLAGAAIMGLVLPFGDFVWPRTPQTWGLVGVLAICSTLIPYWAWNAAQKYLPLTVLGVSAYFTPVAAVALAVLFRGESATGLQWAGTFFICAAACVETHRMRGAARKDGAQT